jgi:hypothetical protein
MICWESVGLYDKIQYGAGKLCLIISAEANREFSMNFLIRPSTE